MELTREALRAVEFRSRGQWYQARQVDQFIEELTVAVDQAQRERDTLRQKLEEARSQREELAARAAAPRMIFRLTIVIRWRKIVNQSKQSG